MTRLLVIMSILLVLASPMARSHENFISLFDGESVITIVESSVHEAPRTNSIQASINGHALSVVFTENLGTVHVEVTDTSGGPVDLTDMYTPTATTPISTTPAAMSSPLPWAMATSTTVSLM